MASEVLVKHGTAIVWADTTDYVSTVSGFTRTDQIDLTSLASGSARQGAKKDMEYLATAKYARRYAVHVGFEFATAPVAGETVDVFWAASNNTTAGTHNPGGTSGSDAAYTGTTGDTEEEAVRQLQYVGSLVCTADATTTVQYGYIGILELPLQYGMPVVLNSTSDAMHSDAVEMYVALIPLVDEVQ